MSRSRLLLCFTLSFGAVSSTITQTPTRPLLLQGALQMETARLVARLEGARADTVGAWIFWRGAIDGYPVVVSRLRMGGTHAAAATALAITRYNPIAIINQGTAGGSDPTLRVYDIVVGTSAVNIGAFKTQHRLAGKGSNTLEWAPLDLVERSLATDDDIHIGSFSRFPADSALLAAARRVQRLYKEGRVVEGVIGSSDVWNEEIDRIGRLRREYGLSVEEFETAPSAQVASLFGVPFLGIRIVAANITNGGTYDARTADACQDFVLQVVRTYVAGLKH